MGRTYDELELRDIRITADTRYPPDLDAPPPSAPQETARMDSYDHDLAPAPLAADGPGTYNDEEEVLKVSAHSRPSAVAGAIAGVIRHHGRAEVQAIGAGATNQAIKAVAIARDYLAPNGIDIVCVPAFIDVTIANEERTAIRLVIESRA